MGIGAGADVLVAKHTTSARVGDSADVRARKDVSVIASGNEEILHRRRPGRGRHGRRGRLDLGAVDYQCHQRHHRHRLGGRCRRQCRIVASDDTETDVIDGTLAAGFGAAGVGGAVGVSRIEKNTTAGVGVDATVKARGNGAAAMQALSGNDLSDRDAITGLMVEARRARTCSRSPPAARAASTRASRARSRSPAWIRTPPR